MYKKLNVTILRASIIAVYLIAGLGITTKTNATEENATAIQMEYGALSEGLRFSIYAKKEEFKVNEPIILVATIQNFSQVTSSYYETRPDLDFTVSAESEDGSPFPVTAYSKVRQEIPFYGRFIRNVRSGQQIIYEIDVSRLIDMTKSGVYNIKLERYILKQPNHELREDASISTPQPINGLTVLKNPISSLLISNLIQIKLTEPDVASVVISPSDIEDLHTDKSQVSQREEHENRNK